MRKLGVRHHLIRPQRPNANGLAERVNGVLTPLLAKLLHTQSLGKWDKLVKKVQLFMNTSFNASSEDSPMRLLCGFNPAVPDRHFGALVHPSADTRESPEELQTRAVDRIKSTFEETKKFYDRRHVAAEKLRTGDVVWFSASPTPADGTSRKLDPLFRGPLKRENPAQRAPFAVLESRELRTQFHN